MKASIIITTFSRPIFLERAILSVINQKTDFLFEIIVVDDNGQGTDMQKQTQCAVPIDSRIMYHPLTKNSGACIARNEGAEIASGEYLFFLDDDDEFCPDKLEQQINYLEINKKDDGCLAAFKRVDQKANEIIADSNFPLVGDFKNFVMRGNFFTAMLCIRKGAFIQSGGFIDIPRFQDRFFMMNMLKNNFKFGILKEQLHIMYEHDGDRITSKSLVKTKSAITQIYDWLESYKDEFSGAEWETIKYNSLKNIAVTKYNASRSLRLKSSLLFLQLFLKKKKSSDLLLMMKSFIK